MIERYQKYLIRLFSLYGKLNGDTVDKKQTLFKGCEIMIKKLNTLNLSMHGINISSGTW